MNMFKKAERKQIKLKLAITGPSGSGKTYSALRLAKGFGEKIAFIDTENGSASLYSDKFEFDVMELSPPYTVEKYITAMKAAVTSGYGFLIVDSITHQWRGEGGILSKKEQLDSRGGNNFTNWGKLTPEQEKFMASILHSNIHMVCTIRSKQEYALGEDQNGKSKVQKLGLAPIQRDGMEYEFTTVFDVAMNHEAEASKDRTGLFAGKMFQINEETGIELKQWLSSGKEVAAVHPINTNDAAKSVMDEEGISEYVVKFGKKLSGKKLKDIPAADLKSYLEYLSNGAIQNGKPLTGDAKELFDNGSEYLLSLIQINTNEAID